MGNIVFVPFQERQWSMRWVCPFSVAMPSQVFWLGGQKTGPSTHNEINLAYGSSWKLRKSLEFCRIEHWHFSSQGIHIPLHAACEKGFIVKT